MNRFQEAEKLAASVRQQLPTAAVGWLAAVREPLQALTMAALDPATTDAMFVQLVEDFTQQLPGLMDTMDHDTIATLMEDGMGAAMANGIEQRIQNPESRKSPLDS